MEIEITKSDSSVNVINKLVSKDFPLEENEEWPENVWMLELPPIYSVWNGVLQKTIHTKDGTPIYAIFAKDYFKNGFIKGIKLYRDKGYWTVAFIPTGEIIGVKNDKLSKGFKRKFSFEGIYTTPNQKSFQIFASQFIIPTKKVLQMKSK